MTFLSMMYSLGSGVVAEPQPCYTDTILLPSTRLRSALCTSSSNRVLQGLRGEGLHHLRGWLRRHLHLLPEHHLLPRLPRGLVLQLQHSELWNHELLGLLHLRIGDGLQCSKHSLHFFRLELGGLADLLREVTLAHRPSARLHSLHSLHRHHRLGGEGRGHGGYAVGGKGETPQGL